MTTYQNITKPTGTTYSNQNFTGKEQFDDANVLYDDPNVFWDGINSSQYTKVSYPLKITWSEAIQAWSFYTIQWGGYTKITKPS